VKEPQKPIEPRKPQEFFEKTETVHTLYSSDSLSKEDILNINFTYLYSEYNGYEGSYDVKFIKVIKVKNKNYKKEYEKYIKEKNKFDLLMIKYEKEMIEYNKYLEQEKDKLNEEKERKLFLKLKKKFEGK
jgi:hypothetical protein